MRQLFVGVLGLIAAFLVVSLLGAGRISADTPVSVLAADEVVLHLPVSPSVERIVADLHLELRDAASAERDSRISAALDRLNEDEELLHQVAVTPVEMFDSGEAAATATAVYDIQLDRERVTVTVITIELVPAYGSTARSREHEDGHALINEKIAKRCAGESLQAGVAAGLQGAALIDRMVADISASGDPVHAAYHSYVGNARYGQHLRFAEQALADVPGC